MGGLVTTTKSGMAVPDWPGTYGYNLFLYPWTTWLLGPWDLFIEHGHRLLASLAGFITLVLMILLWRRDPRPWMKRIGVLALLGVIGQGVLGGVRVLMDERTLAMVHGFIGPLFFALTVAIVIWTSTTWWTAKREPAARSLRWIGPMALATTLLVYAQVILGALLRHLPITASPKTFTLVLAFHMLVAVLLMLMVFVIGGVALWRGTSRSVRRACGGAVLIVIVQISLGAAAWFAKYSVTHCSEPYVGTPTVSIVADGWYQTHLVTAHQATGSLLLVVSLAIVLLAYRLAPPRKTTPKSPLAAENSSADSSLGEVQA